MIGSDCCTDSVVWIGSSMENRTILLSPTDEIITEMDSAAFVCVPVNATMMPSWSPSDGSVMLGTGNISLLILMVTSNATISCTVGSETVEVTVTVQGNLYTCLL